MSDSHGIEIYVSGCAQEQLIAWVDRLIGPLGEPEDAGDTTIYSGRRGSVFITPDEAGQFTSLYFPSKYTPWSTHAECARQAARELGGTVVCDPGEEFPEVDPFSPVFLEVQGDTERLISLD